MKKFLLVVLLAHLGSASVLSDYMAELKAQAGSEFDAKRGEAIFNKKMLKDGKMVNCRSCHNEDLTKAGENYKTGKKIDALAPSANKERLTSKKEMKKWLKRNFKDVYSREGTALEKGDVLLFLSQQ